MTKAQFNAECRARTIDPAIALENDAVWEALAAKNDRAVLAALDEEF